MGDRIDGSNNWSQRKYWVLSEKNIYPSLDALLEAQEIKGTSLGLIKIKKMIDFEILSKTKDEIKDAESKKAKIMKQLNFLEAKKDLELIPFRFSLQFSCDDVTCQSPHKVSVLDWEFGQLYRRLKGMNNWRDLIQKRIREILSPERDTYLFMGNMMSHPKAFSVLGSFGLRNNANSNYFKLPEYDEFRLVKDFSFLYFEPLHCGGICVRFSQNILMQLSHEPSSELFHRCILFSRSIDDCTA